MLIIRDFLVCRPTYENPYNDYTQKQFRRTEITENYLTYLVKSIGNSDRIYCLFL
jgi:hypothetical protein